LDVGSGDGNLFDVLPDLLPDDTRMVGVDFADGDLDLARKRFAHDARMAFVLADAQHLPFEDATFDVVVSHQFLNFVPRASEAIAEQVRVLRPGGTLLVAMNRGWLNEDRDVNWIHLSDAAYEAARALYPEMSGFLMYDPRVYSDGGIHELLAEHPSLRMSTLEIERVYPSARLTPQRAAEIYNRMYVFATLPERQAILEAVERRAREIAGDGEGLLLEIPFRIVRIRKGF
jgi:ubiquinone/menaquinone biosynthesis C-methylase UbiE